MLSQVGNIAPKNWFIDGCQLQLDKVIIKHQSVSSSSFEELSLHDSLSCARWPASAAVTPRWFITSCTHLLLGLPLLLSCGIIPSIIHKLPKLFYFFYYEFLITKPIIFKSKFLQYWLICSFLRPRFSVDSSVALKFKGTYAFFNCFVQCVQVSHP